MAIVTLAQYHAAAKQRVAINKSTLGSASPNPIWCSAATAGGSPSALAAPGNTTTGVVPTNATTGAGSISPFSGTGYLTGVSYAASTATVITLYDRLFHAGAFAAAVGVTSLSGQPSYSSRVPGGTDYTGLQIWLESVGNSGGSATMRVQYTNQAGTAGKITETISKPNNVGGALVQFPLAAGDTGVQTIENFEVVTMSSSSMTWNVFVARPLWTGRVEFDEASGMHWLDRTAMPQVWQDSCLCIMQRFDATQASIWLEAEIASA